MNLHRFLVLSLALLAPAAAHAEINNDTDTDGGGGSTGGGTTGEGTPTWSKNYAKSSLFGSSSWGAGYKIDGGVWAIPASGDYKDRLGAKMNAETYAKLNGGYYRVFAARARGTTEAKRRTDLSFNAYVGSATIYSRAWASTTSTYTFPNAAPDPWTMTFFDKSIKVDVYGVGVTFRVRASGTLKVTLSGKISNIGVEGTGTPSGRASLYASAAVGDVICWGDYCIGAEAGVYSDLDLVSASVPAKAAAWWSLTAQGGVLINYLAKADATITALAGELGVWGRACYIIDCKGGEKELIDWSGFTATYPLLNASGSYCLAGTCMWESSPGVVQ